MTVTPANVEALALYAGGELGSLIDQEQGTHVRLRFTLRNGKSTDILVEAHELLATVAQCVGDRDTAGRRMMLIERDARRNNPARDAMRDAIAAKLGKPKPITAARPLTAEELRQLDLMRKFGGSTE